MDERYLTKDQRKQKIKHRVLLWGSAIIVVFAVVVFVASSVKEEQLTGNLSIGLIAGDHAIGPEDAQVTLIEYSDLQCSACAAQFPLIKALLNDYPKDLRLVYRHFPLREIHESADSASYALEAAAKQNKFMEMMEILFKRQAEWAGKNNADQLFVNYAKELGLEENKFISDSASKEVREKVESDYQSAVAQGLNSTPSFYLNEQRIINPASYEQFKELIDVELKK